MKNIRWFCCLMVMLIGFELIFSISTSTAFVKIVIAAEENDSKGNGSWWIPDTVEKLLENVQNLISNFEDILKYTGRIFKGGLNYLLEQVLGRMFEAVYQWVSAGMSNWLMTTPRLVNQPLLYGGWKIVTVFALIAIAMGAGISFMKVLGGSKNYKEVLSVLLAAFLLCPFTLYLIDSSMQIQNYFWAKGTHTYLKQIYDNATNGSNSSIEHLGKPIISDTRPNNFKDYKEENKRYVVTPENISISNVDGDTLMKLCFAGPENMSQILQIKGGRKIKFYELFVMKESDLDSNIDMSSVSTYGGVLGMSWVMLNLIILGLFAVVRFGSIYILGWLVNFFIASAVIKGKMEPIAGLANILGRIIVLQSLVDFAWIIMVNLNNPKVNLGMNPLVINCFVLTGLNTLVWFFFLTWVKKCIMSPMSLAGAQAMEYFSEKGKVIGNGLSEIGDRFGLEGMKSFGNRMAKRTSSSGTQENTSLKLSSKDLIEDNKNREKDGIYKTSAMFPTDKLDGKEYRVDKDIYENDGCGEEEVTTDWSTLTVGKYDNDHVRGVVSWLNTSGYKDNIVKLNEGPLLTTINIDSKHKDKILSKVREKYFNEDINSYNLYTETKKRNYMDFSMKCTQTEKTKLVESIETELNHKSICSITDKGNIRVASEHSANVENVIRKYQEGKVKYKKDNSKNKYLVYDEKLNEFITYNSAPENGICIEEI